jgi:hypothetical protein
MINKKVKDESYLIKSEMSQDSNIISRHSMKKIAHYKKKHSF